MIGKEHDIHPEGAHFNVIITGSTLNVPQLEIKYDFQMKACYIDVKDQLVEEYSVTWENVGDAFLSEKSCFQNCTS